LANKPPIFG